MELSVGLARAITSLAIAHERSTGVRGSLALWANVLQHVPDDGGAVDVSTLPRSSCLSKRALTTGTKRLARMGLVVVADKSVRSTDAGVDVRQAWRPTEDDASLRAVLVPVVASLELEHPHFPTQYGTADPSITGGPGQDWKPVPRVDGGPGVVGGLPLIALLSQVFVALAIAYEQRNGALAQAANVLSFLPDEGCPASSLPVDSRMVLGGMERHGRVTRAGSGSSVVVTPTSLGRRIRDAHEAVLAKISQRIDPDGTVGSAVSSFVAGRPADHDLAGVFHPETHALFGRFA